MSQQPSLSQKANTIIDIWSEHVAVYATSKREIASLRSLVELMRSRMAELAKNATKQRARLTNAAPAKHKQIKAKLAALQKDFRKYRGCVTKWDQQLVQLEQKLEMTWDIW